MLDHTINAHWSRTANTYNLWARQHFTDGPIRRTWLSRLPRWAGAGRSTVLDVGTGPGIMAFYWAELGFEVTAVDKAEGMLAEARANAAALGHRVHFELADGHKLPFPDASFDIVTNRLVLTQMVDPAAALREWTRVLKPGGRLIVIEGDATMVRGTLKHKLWKVASVPFVYFSEGRNPLRNRMPIDVWNKLPLVGHRRPAWEQTQYRELGLENITVDPVDRRELGWLEYIKHGCWGHYWAVSGDKPR
jgi:ubiquinone/menaquinone biosynthesis C-methylase UbiE